ncbi:hypothetical protein PybrP1_013108 [[Pythium] brassicae (nom. inval.)]|nr:hypothetical protein PybrP1_013108 [[Pythium] brassicae (nom. inval.)]
MRACGLPPAVDELLRGVALCQQLQRLESSDTPVTGAAFRDQASLPTVFYHAALLVGRTSNALCKRLLMNLLLRKSDAVTRGSAAIYGTSARVAAAETDAAAGSSMTSTLLLTVATQDPYEARVTALLVRRVAQSYKADAGTATRSAFLDTIVHPQDGNWNPVTQRMHHESAREKVVEQIVNAIVIQDTGSCSAIALLARIVKRHAFELSHSLVARLQECLDFLVLTLRKAMFRKDDAPRMIAIIGFAFLLGLSSANTSTLLSQGVVDSGGGGGGGGASAVDSELATQEHAHAVDSELATQEHAHAVVAEDLYHQFCGIFKRALQLQTRVRLVLYAELATVFRECPAPRPSILELVFQYYSTFYDANESFLPPLKVDSCLARSRSAYEEPLGLTRAAEVKRESAVCICRTIVDSFASGEASIGLVAPS